MGIRQEQREKRRMDILDAALDLFISKGYSETTIKDIAARVNMSTGLMFHYFKSKAALYEALVRIGVEGPASTMKLDTSDPLRFFETVAAYVLSALKDSPFTAKMFVFMAQARFSTVLPESVRAMAADMSLLGAAVSVMEAGQRVGQIRPGDPTALTILFWQALSGVALYAAFDPDSPIPEAEWIMDCIRRRDT